MPASLPISQSDTAPDSISGGQTPGGSKAAFWADLAILAGAEPGPVLMVVAGVHGDEISGPMAAGQLASGPPPARGTLVILPVAFPEAMAAGQRWLPGWSDLNRAFPQNGEWGTSGTSGEAGTTETGGVARSARSAYAVSDPTYLRADEILALIVSVFPDLLLDLHESDQYWTEGDGPALVVPASVGSAESKCSAEVALALLESPGMEGFVFTGPPPAGSLVAAVDGLLGISALLVETPDSMAVEDRIAVQLAVVRAALRILGMAEPETGAEPTIPLSGKAP
jgi:predicted deacylase